MISQTDSLSIVFQKQSHQVSEDHLESDLEFKPLQFSRFNQKELHILKVKFIEHLQSFTFQAYKWQSWDLKWLAQKSHLKVSRSQDQEADFPCILSATGFFKYLCFLAHSQSILHWGPQAVRLPILPTQNTCFVHIGNKQQTLNISTLQNIQ